MKNYLHDVPAPIIYTSVHTPVLYVQQNAPRYPEKANSVILAPAINPVTGFDTYRSGMFLALFGDDVQTAPIPYPFYEGWYGMVDSASPVASQKKIWGFISDEWAKDIVGVDLSTAEQVARTFVTLHISQFLIGTTFYKRAIYDNNTPENIALFEASFECAVVGENIQWCGDLYSDVLSIQKIL